MRIVLLPMKKKPKFQLFKTSDFLGTHLNIIWHLERIQNGSIVTFLIAGTSAVGIRDAALLFQDLGSVLVNHLQPTSHWIWIFVKGGRTLFESSAIDSMNGVWFDSSVVLDNNRYQNRYGSDKIAELCESNDGLGSFCNPTISNFSPISSTNLPNSTILDNIPVIITGGYRLPYLVHTLISLLNSPGVRKQNIEVFLGDTHQYVPTFLDIIGIKYLKIPVNGTGNGKLFNYYRSVYETVAEKFQNSDAIIFLDEDVEISRDFFSYMSQVIPLLYIDESLYCATSHASDGGYNLNYRIDRIKREANLVLWGYALRFSFIQKVASMWQHYGGEAMYDAWIYETFARGMDCVVPEVSRSKHFGFGYNSVGLNFEKSFLRNRLVPGYGIQIKNLLDVPKKSWSSLTLHSLLEAEVIVGNPCEPSTFSNLTTEGNYVFPYTLEEDENDEIDITNYAVIGECLDFYSHSNVGWFWYVTPRMLESGIVVQFIGVPASPFTKYIKSDRAWNFEGETEEGKDKIRKQSTILVRRVLGEIVNSLENQNTTLDLFQSL